MERALAPPLTKARSRFGFALMGLVFCMRCTAAADCASCHDQGQTLAKSAHSELACSACHESHEQYPHEPGIAKPACVTCHPAQAGDYATSVHGQARASGNEGAPDCALCHGNAHELLAPKSQAFRSAVPDTCSMCHIEVEQYRASVHWQALARGITAAPLCTDCHGEHKIIKHTGTASPVNVSHIRETCGNCHGNVRLSRKFGLPPDRLVSFDSSFHGLAAKAGSQTVANCASCHGVHNVLPSSDPRSTINVRNLPNTCGHCHPGAGSRFAISQIHVSKGSAEPAGVLWVRRFYWFVIPVTIGLMLLHNAGDWVRKLIRLRFRGQFPIAYPLNGGPPEVRMLPFERVQHAVLALSFFVLAWSGFALRYPDQWWARPLLLLEGTRSMRGLIHRVAATVFIMVTVTHVMSLLNSRALRGHWKRLLPNRRDPREALANFAYNLGISHAQPWSATYSYVQKAEYWAVVWGAVLMITSGLMIWANDLVLKLLPKSWLDVVTSIHFYEAVLATLAIVVWHFYSTIFDPDIYPLNTTFWTGRRVETHEHSEQDKTVPHDA